ncbi:uncharacterized protein AMSG_11483 [Thecamonas trahens ATCC 50062]|uniref:ubiquitinyl hydrolase 1 n=1 Tax=Thecamonas trahens ATCC 50062 TaxID=461836 RepID=A0A0L0DV99_THETB|nr:hypothetical protein AMSG_11483 [Thecamonas trahens ATCC 50062]KNC56234.1 hypothetical protein AMSG_11483 [Thecamonas trahens ATCC 50062]|eukprot:XP_013752645.1 hypothetical protein AMSG_11483 [Thecamonas trahens ATCC 50062]
MINGSNVCYVHAVLQALLGSPRVYSAVARLSTITPTLSPAETPTLGAFASLIHDIETAQPVAAGVGAALEPVYFYGLIDAFVAAALGDADGTQTTRQHDAHEWWTFLLSSLDDELRRLDAAPVAAELFAGTLVSQLAGPTGPPSVTRQPFLVLMLDLDAARTLTDALVAAMETEYVEYVDAASGTTHTPCRTPSFGALPPVLVLQCKRFVFHRAYTGKTDVFVGLGATSADADVAVEVELGLWFLAELKRPFDRLAGGGGSAKDQLLLEVAAYAASREASRAEEAPWRPMVGVVTDLFRVNVAFDLPDSAWDDGPWQLGLGTRVVTPAAEYVRVVLGALVLAYWDDVSEGVRAAASAEGAASVSAWVERLVADEDVDVFAREDGSSDDETEADDTAPRPRRALRSSATRSSAAPTAASSSARASSSSHGSGARASQGSVEKRFQRVAATREALLEIVGNTMASR